MSATTIRLTGCYPVILSASLAHWHRDGTHHGAQSLPPIATARLVRLGRCQKDEPSSGWRLWVYVRGGYAWHGDLYIDRRPLVPALAAGASR